MPAEADRRRLRFAVLGPVRAWRDGRVLELGPPQQRAVLALLLARPGQPMEVEEIVDVLWGDDPPVSALTVVYRHIGLLRRLLEPDLPTRAFGQWLLRGAGGYRMEADPDSLDLLRFRQLTQDARRLRDSGAQDLGVARYVEALALWQGPTADGIPPAVRAHPVLTALDRERHAVVKEAADAALRCGRAGELLGALRRCAAERPMDEPLHARLLQALTATGRTQEAVRTYREVRARLGEELGIGPGAELRAAARLVLGAGVPVPPGGAGRSASARTEERRGTSPDAFSVPAQLPADLPVFVGRQRELALMPTPDGGRPGRAAVVAVSGTPGSGKTALAVRWAHRAAAGCPDGQLYANLRGFGPGGPPVDPVLVLGRFLQALGVPPEQVPADGLERARRYREVLAGRRILVVLDDARDAGQVRPLLPGRPGCLAVVTSRGPLEDLAEGPDDVRFLALEPFDADEARDCLAARLGGDRVAAEEDAVAEITGLTGGLPLALAVVAAHAGARPAFPLAATVAELRESRADLDAFAEVRTACDGSYRALSPAAARLLRGLAEHPGRTFDVSLAASAAGVPVERARALLGEIAGVSLLTPAADGRFARHRLLRVHAAELGETHEDAGSRRAALHRILDHCLHTAHGAVRTLSPNGTRIHLPPAEPGVSPSEHPARAAALAWFGAELPVLLEMVGRAAREGFDRHAWQLAWALERLLDQQGLHHDYAEALRPALAAARRLGDPTALAHVHRALGCASARLDRHDDAHAHLRRALDLFGELGDMTGQARTHGEFGRVFDWQGHQAHALYHREQALEGYRAAGDPVGQSGALQALGRTHTLLGQYRQALTHTRQALEPLRGLDEPHAEAAVWRGLGHCHQHLGSHRRAVAGYQRALQLYRAAGDRYNEFRSLVWLGDAHRTAGDPAAARAAWRQALAVRDCAGLPAHGPLPPAEAVRTGLRGCGPAGRRPVGRGPEEDATGRPTLRAVPGGPA
ncbi:BTAD domain-containing putative transcriptional regulator [Streptomyces sp. NPDC004542]|uniref:AfsR/SARP family transcriptional regulator n=1 Tax=Streptomyces sp. NPDC004542 TaxID=3154281 RepID=UPI0033B2ABD8